MKWMVLIVELLGSPQCMLLSGSGSGFIVLKVCVCRLNLPLHSACGGRLVNYALIWDYDLGVHSSQDCGYNSILRGKGYDLQL